MEPRPTAAQLPIHLRIADDLRMKIERGDLEPGESLPTLARLCERWDCSENTVRGALTVLKAQGLITAGRGRPPMVRIRPGRAIRSSEVYQLEKDPAQLPAAQRAAIGEAEASLGRSIADELFESHYDTVPADQRPSHELAALFGIAADAAVLRRRYQALDPSSGRLLSWSVSYIPRALVESNPMLLDDTQEPWPGGTQHQLATVGIEVASMVDHVTARAATTVEAQQWDLPDGVPMVDCRRCSLDGSGRTVEISDATYPADRTELVFTTPLSPWATPSALDTEEIA